MTDTFFNLRVTNSRPTIPDFDQTIADNKEALDHQLMRRTRIHKTRLALSQKYQITTEESKQIQIEETDGKLYIKAKKVDEYIEFFEKSLQQAIDYKAQHYNHTDYYDPKNHLHSKLITAVADQFNLKRNEVSIDQETGEITRITKGSLDPAPTQT